MRASLAAMMAPAIAASSCPPRQRITESGSISASEWRSTPAATTSVFSANTSPPTPVPGPTQSAASPPNNASDIAAAEVVLPMPISPRHRTSVPASTVIMP